MSQPSATPRREVTGLIEVLSDLSVTPSTGPQGQDSVNQGLLIVTQWSNVERDMTASNDETLCGFFGGTSAKQVPTASLHREGIVLIGSQVDWTAPKLFPSVLPESTSPTCVSILRGAFNAFLNVIRGHQRND